MGWSFDDECGHEALLGEPGVVAQGELGGLVFGDDDGGLGARAGDELVDLCTFLDDVLDAVEAGPVVPVSGWGVGAAVCAGWGGGDLAGDAA